MERKRFTEEQIVAILQEAAGRPAVWLMAAATNEALMVQADPTRYFVPPFVGGNGWVGVWSDRCPRWAELAARLRDAYCRTEPKRLVSRAIAHHVGRAAPPEARVARVAARHAG